MTLDADLMRLGATVTRLPRSRNADVEWTARLKA
jgi:hypothetical protein